MANDNLSVKVALLSSLLAATAAQAGIFAPAAGESGSTAVDDNDPGIESWATGYKNYSPGSNVDAEFQTPEKSVGVAGNSDGTNQGYTFDIVSLGRGGSITLKFNPAIKNGPGFDFAVFENSFSNTFLELAKVEVSTDGQTFVPFPAFSTVPGPVSGFGNMDPTDLEQLAGKYRAGFGTPFDLDQLSGSQGINLNRVRFVRLNDVIGDGTAPNDLSAPALADWLGVTVGELPQSLIDVINAAPPVIYDPYPTSGSAGFDLDAVAVLNAGSKQAATDIDVWSPLNEIDPASTGTTTVGLFTTSLADGDELDFDATSINSATVQFGPWDAPVVGAPVASDLDSDGDMDMTYSFEIAASGIVCDDTFAVVNGSTIAGDPFYGSDSITTIECDSGCH